MRFVVSYKTDGETHEIRRASIKAAQAAVLDLVERRIRGLSIIDTELEKHYSSTAFLKLKS